MTLYTEMGEETDKLYESIYLWLESKKDAEEFENIYDGEIVNYEQSGIYKYNSVSGEYDCIMEDIYIYEKIMEEREKNK